MIDLNVGTDKQGNRVPIERTPAFARAQQFLQSAEPPKVSRHPDAIGPTNATDDAAEAVNQFTKTMFDPVVDPHSLDELDNFLVGPFAVHRGAIKSVVGMASPANAAIVAGTMGVGSLGPVGKSIQIGLEGYFGAKGVQAAGEHVGEGASDIANGNWDTGLEKLGAGSTEGLLAALAIRAGARGLPEVYDQFTAALKAHQDLLNAGPDRTPATSASFDQLPKPDGGGGGDPAAPAKPRDFSAQGNSFNEPGPSSSTPVRPNIREGAGGSYTATGLGPTKPPEFNLPEAIPHVGPDGTPEILHVDVPQNAPVGLLDAIIDETARQGVQPGGSGASMDPDSGPAGVNDLLRKPGPAEDVQGHDIVDPRTGQVTRVQTRATGDPAAAGGTTTENAPALEDMGVGQDVRPPSETPALDQIASDHPVADTEFWDGMRAKYPQYFDGTAPAEPAAPAPGSFEEFAQQGASAEFAKQGASAPTPILDALIQAYGESGLKPGGVEPTPEEIHAAAEIVANNHAQQQAQQTSPAAPAAEQGPTAGGAAEEQQSAPVSRPGDRQANGETGGTAANPDAARPGGDGERSGERAPEQPEQQVTPTPATQAAHVTPGTRGPRNAPPEGRLADLPKDPEDMSALEALIQLKRGTWTPAELDEFTRRLPEASASDPRVAKRLAARRAEIAGTPEPTVTIKSQPAPTPPPPASVPEKPQAATPEPEPEKPWWSNADARTHFYDHYLDQWNQGILQRESPAQVGQQFGWKQFPTWDALVGRYEAHLKKPGAERVTMIDYLANLGKQTGSGVGYGTTLAEGERVASPIAAKPAPTPAEPKFTAKQVGFNHRHGYELGEWEVTDEASGTVHRVDAANAEEAIRRAQSDTRSEPAPTPAQPEKPAEPAPTPKLVSTKKQRHDAAVAKFRARIASYPDERLKTLAEHGKPAIRKIAQEVLAGRVKTEPAAPPTPKEFQIGAPVWLKAESYDHAGEVEEIYPPGSPHAGLVRVRFIHNRDEKVRTVIAHPSKLKPRVKQVEIPPVTTPQPENREDVVAKLVRLRNEFDSIHPGSERGDPAWGHKARVQEEIFYWEKRLTAIGDAPASKGRSGDKVQFYLDGKRQTGTIARSEPGSYVIDPDSNKLPALIRLAEDANITPLKPVNGVTVEPEASDAELPGTTSPEAVAGGAPAPRRKPRGKRGPRGDGQSGVETPHRPDARPDGEPADTPQSSAGDGERGPTSPHGSRPARPRRESAKPDLSHDYRVTEGDQIGAGTLKEKVQANIDAIRTLKQIEEENRAATPAEQAILAKYTGWGAASQAFEDLQYIRPEWKQQGELLRELLTPEEFASARASTTNAHYTSPLVVGAMWDAMRQLGMQGGERVLEPSMGIGNFYGMMPEDLADGSRRTGIELDSITGRMAKLLYPGSHVHVAGFQDVPLPDNFFDVAISNVPFGNYGVSDPKFKGPNSVTRSIHNYFFAKALEKVRAGGVVAFVTSSFTMDAQDPAVREYLASQGDLLGAIRLPNTAFKGNAGTEVVTDIIFLRKREPGAAAAGEAWTNTAPIKAQTKRPDGTKGETEIRVNEYFAAHPEMILGTPAVERGMYNDHTPTVEGKLTPELLAAAIAKLPKGALKKPEKPAAEPEPNIPLSDLPDPGAVKDGGYVYKDGRMLVRDGAELKPANLELKQIPRVRGMLLVRDAYRQVLREQLNDADDAAVKKAQKFLTDAYDSFVKQHGNLSSRDNVRAFAGDPDAPFLLGLENVDPKTKKVTKAQAFTERTIARYRPPESAPDAAAALAIALTEFGSIHWGRLQKLTGMERAELEQELVDTGLAFLNPQGDTWETADDYLSGKVRAKLQAAEAAAAIDPKYQPNVEALKKVQPTDLGPGEIDARLGAGWIPKEHIKRFIVDVLKLDPNYVKVGHSDAIASWNVRNTGRSSVANNEEFGGYDYTGVELVQMAMNLKLPTVRVVTDPKTGATAVDPKATAALREKQDKLKEKFKKWIWEDAKRAEECARLYNEGYNDIRLREFDGKHLNFPGMAPGIKLRDHQKNAVWRMLQGGNTLLAHVVGAGKTFAMVAGAMEMKRLGLAKKPMICVPNHLVDQWATEFLQLYPNANLFVAGKETFSKGNRQRAMAKIAAGNFDAIIISHNSFGKLPVSDATFSAWLNSQIKDLVEAIREASATEGSKSITVKELEKTKKRLEEKLKRRSKREAKDKALDFEDLGIDQLFVDESHAFKNLFFTTKMTRIAGIPNTESNRAIDMFLKTQWLTKKNNGRGVVFATGTPISNTMAEMYTVMRYLQSAQLRETGLAHFDAWAQMYGESVTSLELAPDGSGYRMNSRFSRFTNLPELANAFRVSADVQTAEMLDLPRPKIKGGKPTVVASEASEEMKAYVQTLVKRAESIKGKRVEKGGDNMLKITGDGRKAALDFRLVHPNAADNPDSKTNKAVDKIFGIWERTKEQRSTQLVFSDLSTPNGEGFNVYADARAKLLARGIPAAEIAFIHDYDTDDKKKKLFDAVNAGTIRILFGSTEKMGAGMNVQRKLIALHHLDAPWRPSDIEQREGRILRQGNENPEIEIFRYVTTGSFDAYIWQTLENKARFIAQVMRGNTGVRSAEDVEGGALTYAEIKGIASGNPRVVEKIKTDMEVRKLDALRSEFVNQQFSIRRQVGNLPDELKYQESSLADVESDIARRDNAPDKLWHIGGEDLEGKDAGPKIHELLEADRDRRQADRDKLDRKYRPLEYAARQKIADAKIAAEATDEEYVHGSKADLKRAQEALKELEREWNAEAVALADAHKPIRLGTYRGFELWTNEQGRNSSVNQEEDGTYRRVYGLASITIQGTRKYRANANEEGNPAGTLASIRYHIDGLDLDARNIEDLIARTKAKLGELQVLLDRKFEHEDRLNELLQLQEQLNRELDLNKGAAGTEGEEQKVQTIEKAPDEDDDEPEESAAKADVFADLGRLVVDFWRGEEGEHNITRTLEIGAEIVDDYRKALNPMARGPEALEAALALREYGSRAARDYDKAKNELKAARRHFLNLSHEAALDFIDAIESDDTPQLPAELQGYAATMRRLLDERRDAVQRLGTNKLTQFYETYFPHLWKRRQAAEKIFRQIFARRPIEGGKAFLKKRKYKSFREGVEAGLEPVSWNPVDLVMLKLKEMDRYLLAHRFLLEMKARGMAKFVRAKNVKAHPKGWVEIPDPIGKVWGPPFVRIPEAHDKQFIETTLGLAQELGLKIERVAKLRAAWGRAYKGADRAKTKFAGPESVILHELGHLLDWRYGIGEQILGKAPYRDELRKLADLRLTSSSTPYFQRYVRQGEEKIANMIAAYGHAPRRFEEVAPETYKWFSHFIDQHPELAALKNLSYGLQIRQNSIEYPIDGIQLLGHYFMPESAAQVVKNYLSPGLRGKAIFKLFSSASNTLLQFALGLSGFHLGFVSFDAMVSKLALAIEQAGQGKLKDAAKNAAIAGTPLAAPILSILKGEHLLKAWDNGTIDPELGKMLDALQAGGGRVRMDDFYQTKAAERIADIWRANPVMAALAKTAAHPLDTVQAAVETSMWPIMQYLIPRMKLGTFADLMANQMERMGPGATHEELRAAAAKVWDSVDNRLGQLVYDNTFWARTAKDLGMMSVQSLGWNLGTFRELGGGAIDTVRFGGQVGKRIIRRGGGSSGGGRGGSGSGRIFGEPEAAPAPAAGSPEFTHRMAYLMALFLLTGFYGAIWTYLHTKGTRRPDGSIDTGLPQDWRDYYFPRTGGYDEQGHAERMALWGYAQDVFHWAHDPWGTARGKLNPLLRLLAESIENKDFYDKQIRNANDPLVKRALAEAKHIGSAYIPYSWRNIARERARGADLATQASQMVGLKPAPAWVTRSKAQLKMAELAAQNRAAGGYKDTGADRAAARRDLVNAIRQRDQGAIAIARKNLAAGKILPKDITAALGAAGKDRDVTRFRQLPVDDALAVYREATDAEKKQFRPILLLKLVRALQTHTPEEFRTLRDRFGDLIDELLRRKAS